MIDLKRRIEAFVKLGKFMGEFCEYSNKTAHDGYPNKPWFHNLEQKIRMAGESNGWFTEANVLFALKSWSKLLTEDRLLHWLSAYNLEENKKKNVALIMAGNIPLVGFHDFLAALLTGNSVQVKLSSNDKILLPFLAEYLREMEPTLKNTIRFTEKKLDAFDAIIATGSDNTARYFEYYFAQKPNLIRKNRNSVAVLTGNESPEQLKALGEDIFRYYGLGCRSVSKIFVPMDYDFDVFFTAIYPYKDIINHQKYANNYDYNKAVYLMSEFKILDNGFLMLKEDESYASPIASLFYERYASLKDIEVKLEQDKHKIQCVVSHGNIKNEVPFGKTQTPSLTDYADGVDTVDFLLKT
ncbi:acyl-CoA reductase [Ulvibacterium marinum]|uniref:acyl-CoA reductase n=1 Tax=Ulvibacterium marinum TaxID=2419782 RepID=UPI002494159C|nr:acyl-CoA reductase [Ulvibacterium marinum]